jgi:hypothetical protein
MTGAIREDSGSMSPLIFISLEEYQTLQSPPGESHRGGSTTSGATPLCPKPYTHDLM